jgi:glyoxylase-like metal-dependent hydrolase (beta-lactamase superfamily II)
MAIPLEDNFTDIIGKAQRGLGISDSQLAEKSTVSMEKIHQLRDGKAEDDALKGIAPILNLDPSALVASAREMWKPRELGEIEDLAQFNTRYGDMTVNAYLVWDPQSRDAVAFDTGADCSEMLKCVGDEKLNVQFILLTHAHPDHIEDLNRLRKITGAPVFISDRESAPGAQSFAEGKHFQVGNLQIETRLTWGHSPGGTTFVINGLAHPVAIVGDSLFAGSMGGGSVSYEHAVKNNLEKILTLPDDTIICPGHGPMTTVGEEKRHNPFFAAASSF